MLEKSFEPELSQSFITEILGVGIMTIFASRFASRWLKKD